VVLADIGSQWEKGNISLSQVYLSSRICEELINKVLPTFKNSDGDTPKIAIVTLEDHHVLGKRIVSSVIRSYGYNLIDYGHGIGYREVIDRISQENLEILLISALMLPSAIKVKNISDFVKDNNLKTKIIVGGAPFNFDKGLWKGVGADRMGLNASEGVKIIKEMLGEGEQ
jgi:methanogenic corrinoid protein MtbC1